MNEPTFTSDGGAATFIGGGLMWLFIWFVFAAGFGVAGGLMAKSRGSTPWMGVALGICCGLFGLLFVMALPVSESLPENRRRESLLAGPDDLDGRPVDQWRMREAQDPAFVAAPPPVVPAGWAPDPSGRFAHRWWDGGAWTAHVRGHDGLDAVDQPY